MHCGEGLTRRRLEVDAVIRVVATGIGATALMDVCALLLRRAFRVRSLDYALVGRWLAHMRGGRFIHANIAAAAPVRGEAAVGWVAHYAIGAMFAGLLVALCGETWLHRPTPVPALAFGLVTVAVPFLVMQPALGLGVAASKAPRPNIARLRSIMAHGIFGVGLYGTARVLAWLVPW
jgi:hypothetical protein